MSLIGVIFRQCAYLELDLVRAYTKKFVYKVDGGNLTKLKFLLSENFIKPFDIQC